MNFAQYVVDRMLNEGVVEPSASDVALLDDIVQRIQTQSRDDFNSWAIQQPFRDQLIEFKPNYQPDATYGAYYIPELRTIVLPLWPEGMSGGDYVPFLTAAFEHEAIHRIQHQRMGYKTWPRDKRNPQEVMAGAKGDPAVTGTRDMLRRVRRGSEWSKSPAEKKRDKARKRYAKNVYQYAVSANPGI
jgi:hypothetical protein